MGPSKDNAEKNELGREAQRRERLESVKKADFVS